MFKIINTAENFGNDAWFMNESDIEFKTEAEAETAANHLNAEWGTNCFSVEETLAD